MNNPSNIIVSFGSDFFERAINSLAFSHDSKLIAAVGCDDYHMMGVYVIETGERLISMAVSHGLPPQVDPALHSTVMGRW